MASLCFVLMVSVTFVYTAASIIVRPSMYSDGGWGFLGWESGQRASAGFNYSMLPDLADISKDAAGFGTVWSPGQNVFPELLASSGLSLGLSIALVTAAFSALGLVGWYLLYRAFGFPLRTAMIALAIVASNRFFNTPFLIYNGGEVLLFGVAPYFALMVWKLRSLRWSAVTPMLVGTFVLFFAKLSGIIFAAATIGAAATCGAEAWRDRDTLRKMVVAVVTVGLVGVTFYFAWYSRGWTPVHPTSQLNWARLPMDVAYAISASCCATLSLPDMASYILMYPGRAVLKSIEPGFLVFLPIAVGVFAVTWSRLRGDYDEYLRFVSLIAVASIAVLLVTWVRGSVVGHEERHLRLVALLFLAGIVHAFVEFPGKALRTTFALVVVGASLYGLASFAIRVGVISHGPLGDRGFRHMIASPEVLDFMRKIDVAGPDRAPPLVLVPTPEMALDFARARVMANQADFDSPDELRARIYRGRVARLYVIMQNKLVANGKADIILRSFADYAIDAWQTIPLGDFVCFYQELPAK